MEELPESAFSFETSAFKLLVLQLYLFHIFQQGVNLDSFISQADCSFLGVSNYDL